MDELAYTQTAHRSRTHRWRRDTVELAAVFLAASTADLLAGLVVHGHDGRYLLAGAAAALVATSLVHSWWTHRHPHGPPVPGPPGDAEVTGDFTEAALWRVRTTVEDFPGSLGRVCTALAELGVNIVSMQAHPLPSGTVDEFLLRTPKSLARSGLAGAVAAAGGRDIWTEQADAHDLVDVPTHVLGLATRTALDAAELPVALRQLFGRCTIRQYPDGALRHAAGIEGETMRLVTPGGDLVELTRPQLPFTPTEFARGKALLELDSVLGPRVPKVAARVTARGSTPAGTELTVRRADRGDKAEALAMHHRCSSDTLRKRYHGPVQDADRYLDHLLDPRHGQTLAVETTDGRIVALAHLMWDDEGAEVALLVEDAWQRHGIGVDLLQRMAALALEAGMPTVYAVTHYSNTGLVATMRKLAAPLDYQVESGTLVITAHLAEAADQLPTPWPSQK